MTISLGTIVENHVDSGAAATTLTVTFTPTAGDGLLIYSSWEDAPGTITASVSDSVNGSYGSAIQISGAAKLRDTTDTQSLGVWFLPNCGAGSTTVTVTYSSSTAYRYVAAIRIPGAKTASAISSTTVGQVQLTPTTGAGAVTTPTFTVASQPALVVAFSFNSSGAGGPAAVTTGGWTDNGTIAWPPSLVRVMSQRVTATGTKTPTFTAGSNAPHMTIALAIDEVGASGGTVVDVPSGTPVPPKPRPPQVDIWEPLGSVAVAAVVASGIFSALSPVVAKNRVALDAWEPLPGVSATTAVAGADCSPTERARAATVRVDAWEPIGGIAPSTPAFTGFERSPLPGKLVTPRVDSWEPLPSPPTSQLTTSWGFSGGESLIAGPAYVDAWMPLPVIQNTATVIGGFECQPVHPVRRAQVRGDAWEPLGQLPSPGAGFDCQPAPGPRLVTARGADSWEPVPGLPPTATAVDCSPAERSRSALARVDTWAPLPALPSSPASNGFECSPLPRRVTAARVDAWEPLGSVAVSASDAPAVECSVVAISRLVPVRLDAWSPIAGIAPSTPAYNGFEPSPVNAKRPTSRGQDWEPLPGLIVLVALPGVDCSLAERSRFTPAKADAWEPLGGVTVPATSAVGGFEFTPTARRVAPLRAVDAWAPLASLPPSSSGFGFSGAEQRPRPPVRPEPWQPLPSLTQLPPFAAFDSALPPRFARALPDAWAPIPALLPPPPVLPWVDFISPIPRFVVSRLPQGDGGASASWLGGVVIRSFRSVTVVTFAPNVTPTSRIT